MLSITCPRCHTETRAPDESLGKVCRCLCGQTFQLIAEPAQRLAPVNILAPKAGASPLVKLVACIALAMVAIGLILILFAVFGAAISGPVVPIPVTAQALCQASWRDLEGGRYRYVGKLIDLRGAVAVARAWPDDGSAPFVLLDQGPNPDDDSDCVICQFGAADREIVRSLRKDQWVTIRGHCIETRAVPHGAPFFELVDCVVVEARP